ncbi:hypothetical protein QL285_015643 [Trifolium repens]|nr:hypothetical protein QL285_015643 [Trifolium repens]
MIKIKRKKQVSPRSLTFAFFLYSPSFLFPISSNLHLHASQGPSFHPRTSQSNPKSFVSYMRIRQTVIPSFRPNTPQSPWNPKSRDFSLDPAKTYYQTLNSFFQHLCFPYALLLRPFVGF